MTAPFLAFARRLDHALDLAGAESGRSRNGALSRRYGVSRETSRKWLKGLALPELERMIELAIDHHVSFEWLATGRGEPHQAGSGITEPPTQYADPQVARIYALLAAQPPKKRQALLDLLAD